MKKLDTSDKFCVIVLGALWEAETSKTVIHAITNGSVDHLFIILALISYIIPIPIVVWAVFSKDE
jgi:hypothetical protein